jgi:flavin reductase (DIM6/NTAB) family NADH-FMN oxidoreductase RutF
LSLETIPIEAFTARSYAIWEHGWFLLTSGDFAAGHYNTMTVSWGAFGCMWGRPFAQVVVRPHRYTFEFIETYPTFTLCAFSRDQRKALNLLGVKSGRDGDKIAQAGLTPLASAQVAAPVFAEAELAIECRKLYWQDFDPAHFLDPALDKNYPRQDYHRVYYGEILAVRGLPSYLAA